MFDIKESNYLLGMMISGDVGPITFYTNQRSKHVIFDKKRPLNPASQLQLRNRNRLRAIAEAWNGLEKVERDQWELCSKRIGCRCIGYHLWVWWNWKHDLAALRTIERLSNLSLIT